jgi:hypothetical protein
MGSKLFYNEVPKPTVYRHKGHLDNPEKTLYSFTHGDQDKKFLFGLDTSTPEGRAEFEEEWAALAAMAPELIDKDAVVYPTEHSPAVSSEPHFQRMWQHYREHSLKIRYNYLIQEGHITESDAQAFHSFVNLAELPSVLTYIMGRYYSSEEFQNQEGFQATSRVFEALQLNELPIDFNSSETPEAQFWRHLDFVFELSEDGLREELPYIVTNPADQNKWNAILEGREHDAMDREHSKRLSA